MLEVAGEHKDKVANTQGQSAPTETVDAGWESWALTDPDPDSP